MAEQNERVEYRLRLSFERPDDEVVAQYRDLPSATISDALRKQQTLPHNIKSVYTPFEKIVGPALTVAVSPGDELLALKAIEIAEPGDVIIVSGAGPSKFSLWGGIMSTMAKVRGVAGLVTDGLVRDVDQCRQLPFTIFAAGVTPVAPSIDVPPGSLNYPITFGEVIVHPGDLIVADEDGVVIVPKGQLVDVAEDVRGRLRREEEWLEKIYATRSMILTDRVDSALNNRTTIIDE